MTLINHNKKYIHIKSQKTASTSIEEYFYTKDIDTITHYMCDDYDVFNAKFHNMAQHEKMQYHMTAQEVKNVVDDSVWNTYFKFSTVRNPFDQLISWFYFNVHISREGRDRPSTRFHMNHDTIHNMYTKQSRIQIFRKWLLECDDATLKYHHNYYSINDVNVIDYYIRTESIFDGLRYICEYFDIPFKPKELLRYKAFITPKDIPTIEYYDDECIDKVIVDRKWEIERFGYTVENALN